MKSSAAEEARFRCEDLIALEGDLLCGEGGVQPLGDGDLSVRQAITALKYAQPSSGDVVRWEELGLAAFSDAARQDRLFCSASSTYRGILEAYDEEHGGELVHTAECLVQTSGDIKETSEALFQHPNTVRYRIRKMKVLFGMGEMPDKTFLVLLYLVFMPVLGG